MLTEQIVTMAVGNGIFAVLFVFLLFYQLKDSAKREKKYQDTISSLSKSIEIVTEIKENVVEVKKLMVFEKKKRKSANEI